MLHFEIDMATAMPVEANASPDLLFDLGMLYASGRTGAVDLVAAHKWFNLAAVKGRSDAVPMRREIAELMSEAEIAQAQREARAWMQTHH
jgi:TPR repeat protein